MTAYEPELWHDLFVMTGGATAALAGLIFVAVSLNHEDILKIPARQRGYASGSQSSVSSIPHCRSEVC